ncbi:MAG: ATP-binding region ATPase domain protein [Gemmatimonadetes bacterium]|nr:ATP-binding region ATPase domain protein [Gemmatimonadota bacterium]
MTLRTRLALSLVVIAAVLVVPLLVARSAIERLKTDIRDLREVEFKASLVLGRLRDAIGDVRAREVALNVVKSDTVRDQLDVALQHATRLADSLVRFKVDSSAARIQRSLAAIGPAAQAEYEAVRADSSAKADTISQKTIAPLIRDAERALFPAEQELRRRTGDKVARAEEALIEAEQVSLAALAVALLLATVIALWLTRSISQPVRALELGMRAVADGELDHKLNFDVTREDEFGRLAASYREMAKQLAELDKLKAEFVSIASHELKTPINVILGYLQLMEEGVYGELTEKQKPITKTIQAQAKTLSRLAGQLLDVSRFEAGGGRIEPRPIKLPHMLDELERAFHVLAVQRGIDFRVTRQANLPVDVIWDWERINEVTGNLLSNAFKFTPSAGTVELIAGPHENGVCIEVRDTGAGIKPDQLKRVFEKFYQADNQKSASAKGTGLGLAIAKEIVEAHQGRISVTSVLGKGTTFTLILPKAVVNRRRSSAYKIVVPPGMSA